MKPGKDNRKATNVGEWLQIATEGIATAGKERIGREIGAHYAEAVETHREKGESEEVARARALEELGKPRRARRRFKGEYLTVGDEKYVNDLLQAALRPMRSQLLASRFVIITLYCSNILFEHRHLSKTDLGLMFAVWCTVVLLFPAIAHVLAKTSRSDTIKMTLLDLDCLLWTLGVVMCTVFLGSEIATPGWRCVWLLFCVLVLVQSGRLWQKRRNAVRSGGGMPTEA